MKTGMYRSVWMAIALTALLAGSQGCGGEDPTHNQNNHHQQPVIGESVQSECLNKARQPGSNVEVLVDGDSLTIVDHYTEFNCCLEVWMEVEVIENRIVVVEVEDPDTTMACDCICPYELSVGVSSLEDGEYLVEVYHSAEQPSLLLHSETVVIGSSQPECEIPADCLDHTWGIYCQGHWSCDQGECVEVCDMQTCGDGTCDSEAGENIEACKVDCEPPVEAVLESFAPTCGECGDPACYEPGAPYGESQFDFEVVADSQNPGQYLLRATHQVQCIDVAILGAELESQGTELILTETFDYDNPVDCYCTYSADLGIAGLVTGTYQLKIYDNDHTRLLVDQSIPIGY